MNVSILAANFNGYTKEKQKKKKKKEYLTRIYQNKKGDYCVIIFKNY